MSKLMNKIRKVASKISRSTDRVGRIALAAANPAGAVLRRIASGDARSYFYGDPKLEIDPAAAGDELVGDMPAGAAVEEAVIDTTPSDVEAAARLNVFKTLSPSDKARMTYLPVLAVWNGQIKVNPLLGKILASALNYNLQKCMNEYPTAGQVVMGEYQQDGSCVVTIQPEADAPAIALPFVIITISASALNARPGASVAINFNGTDEKGRAWDSEENEGEFAFFRLSTTESIVLVYVPFTKVATRTLPFMPVATNEHATTFTIKGLESDEQVALTVPGYATRELSQVAKMYNLPAGDIA